MTRMIPAVLAIALAGPGLALAQSSAPSTAPATTPPTGTTGTTMGTTGTTTTPGTAATPAVPNTAVSTDRNSPGTSGSPAAVSTTGAPSRTTEAPVPGANSFTEGQAKSRMEDRGYSSISNLRKDDQGIWRASATKDGRQVTVSLDYQGNIVDQ